jgi:glycosyltransferase involved in cell wall biosynthesis
MISSKEVIVHGKALKEICLSMKVPENKIEVVPHGDFSFYLKFKKKEDSYKCHSFTNVLFFGRIEPYKGLEYFIRAGELISSPTKKVVFTIAGAGNIDPYRNLIINSKKFLIINQYFTDQEISTIFENADIVVLPYLSASQSGVIPIAYAFKKPVIVTSVGALPETVENGVTGLIIPPRDVDALVNAITTLLADEDLRVTMGKNAYNKMKSDLSWEVIAKRHSEIYRQVLTKSK